MIVPSRLLETMMTSQRSPAIKSLTVKPFPQGHQQSPDAFDQQTLAAAGDAINRLQNFRQGNRAVVSPGSDKWSKRLRKEKRSDLLGSQLAILGLVQ